MKRATGARVPCRKISSEEAPSHEDEDRHDARVCVEVLRIVDEAVGEDLDAVAGGAAEDSQEGCPLPAPEVDQLRHPNVRDHG